MKKIGFIGCGKMAGAIISAIKNTDGYEVVGSEISEEIAKSASKKLQIKVLTDNIKLANDSEIIFIATKPNQEIQVLEEIKDCLNGDKLIISICAGVTLEKIEKIVSKSHVIRIMPNTPALVKLGMFGVCAGKLATEKDVEFVKKLLSNIGKCIEVNEKQMDIVTAISGSGPAFFYQIIEDMAKAGEKLGLEYEKSLILATQTALGSAQMIFERGETPVQTLIDNVATKGGCTFVGIQEMARLNSKDFFFNVIEKTTNKASELGK